MTTTRKVTVTRHYEITIETGDIDTFVDYMEMLSWTHLGHGLDSMDEGDAVGAVLDITHKLGSDATWSIDAVGTVGGLAPLKVTSTYEDDLFDWDSPSPA